jgi:hypothetical protein
VDTLAVPGHIQEALNSDQSEPNAVDERKVDPTGPSPTPSAPPISHDGESCGSTLPTLPQMFPMPVFSIDAVNYPPLKSVARHLCIVLESGEVQSPFCTFNLQCLQLHQQTKVNKQAIEWLAPRIKALSKSLCAPIPEGDINEGGRENKLER